MTATTTPIDPATRTRLRAANLALAIVHLAQAVAIVVLSTDVSLPVTARFQDGPPGSEQGAVQTLFEVPIGPAVALFLVLAALDHLVVALPGVEGWYARNLARGRNDARWIEYSLSASLMVVLIAMLTGISSVYALVAIVGVNAAMIWFGLLMEHANPPGAPRNWLPFLLGCLAGVVPWIAITIAIVGAEVEYGGVPTFVFVIFVTLFVLFNSFAVNQFLQYREVGRWRSPLVAEAGYLVLSLVAKSALAWQVFAGALAS